MSVHTMPYLHLNLNPVRAGIFIVNLQMWKLRRSEKADGYPNSTASNVLPWISHLTPLGCRVLILSFQKIVSTSWDYF